MDEAGLMLENNTEDDVSFVWRMINDTVYSGWKVVRCLKESENEDRYLELSSAGEVLEGLMGYGTYWVRDGNKSYMDGTVIHLTRLVAWTGCAVTTKHDEVKRSQERQTWFSALYRRYLRRAVADILKMVW